MRHLILVLALIATSCSGHPSARTELPLPVAAPQTQEERAVSEAQGPHAIISTQGRASTQAASQILRKGGNLVDAAIAASFAISVERPHSTGLGGGGFLLYREAKTGKTYAIDFRERAPKRASEGMYLDPKGEVIPRRSLDGIFASGVPGLVAGLIEIHQRFGSLPLSTLVQPAIDLAERGFKVYPRLAQALEERKQVLARYPASARIFLHPNGEPYREGETLVQRDLAKTLRKIAQGGKKAFYQGSIGQAIVRESHRLHGLLGSDDLNDYQVHWREPVRGQFKGYELVSMPPPSSGGTHVIEILQILGQDSLRSLGALSPRSIHLEASAMQLAFADRARYMGDPDFVKVPVQGLVSRSYAQAQRSRIQEDQETPSAKIEPGKMAPGYESSDTTHFSMMDDQGNVIASTQTINGYMGSGVVVPGTGIVLNNEMDDFSAKPGASNLFGAVGGKANAIAPHKTPLSSMAPTIVLKDGKPIMAVGAPGGTRIITCVAQTLLNYLEFGLPLYESVATIRFHHQWKPDRLEIDSPGPGAETVRQLQRMGYEVKVEPDAVFCRVMAVASEGGMLHGVADPRDIGSSAGL